MASPQAIISEGASLLSTSGRIFEDNDMLANGLAMLTSMPVLSAMISSAPGMEGTTAG